MKTNKATATAWILLFLIIISKISVFKFLSIQPFGVVGDADHYHAYATGLVDNVANFWSVILRALAETGWYSRQGVAWLLLGLNAVAIPALAACASSTAELPKNERHRIGVFVALLVSLYPVLYFYALDIYRDVFMVFVFAVALCGLRPGLSSTAAPWPRFAAIVAALTCIGLLYLLRPYLGMSMLLALLAAWLFDFRRARLLLYLVVYLTALNFAFLMGFLDKVALEYRAIFTVLEGETNIGIVFDSPLTFLPQFALSWLYQVPGFYFPTPLAWLPFLLESVPFLIASWWLLKNRRYANRFVSFLIIFFVIYSTIWALGNDNLGAAVRLRIFNYFSILIACAVVYGRKCASQD